MMGTTFKAMVGRTGLCFRLLGANDCQSTLAARTLNDRDSRPTTQGWWRGSATLRAVLAGAWFMVGTVTLAQLTDADKKAIAEANKYITRGNEFVQKDSLARAKAEYQRALKIYPRHVDALYNLAVTCERLGQNPEALTYYQQYLAIRPNDADVWTQLGVRHDEAGERVEAEAAYQKALAADPNFGRAHHNLGVLYKEQGKLDEAQKEFERFVALEEKAGNRNGDAYYSLGSLLLARGKIKDAKQVLQKALDTDPSIPYYNNAMGAVYVAEKEYQLAESAYRRALAQDPKYAPALSGLGDVYRQLGQREKAAETYREALKLRKDYHIVHYKLGLLNEDWQPAEAIKSFENYLTSGKNLEFQTEAQAKIQKLKQAHTK
jgi:tetratricopeptide (TPR) repeat protein